MKNNLLAFIGAIIAITFYISSLVFDLDLFEVIIFNLEKLEHLELDEFILPILIFLFFLAFNQTTKSKIALVEIEKQKIFNATLSSAKHIINNFLNQIILFKTTSEETDGFPKDILDLYDVVINETSKQLDSLSSVTNISKTTILYSISPKNPKLKD